MAEKLTDETVARWQADRGLQERLLHGRELTVAERVTLAERAVEAAIDALLRGYGPEARVDWAEAELRRLRGE